MLKLNSVALGASLALYASSPAWALNIADVPLFQSTTVAPNVMLLVDNSGSMNNIIQAEAALSASWPAIRYVTRSGPDLAWAANMADSNIDLSAVEQYTCSSGFKALYDAAGNNGRCYVLPDPVGGGLTRYTANYLAYIYANYTNANNDLTTLSDAVFPKQVRMTVAKESATSIVNANRSMRIGLSSFNSPIFNDAGPGGSINSSVVSLSSSTSVTQAQADANYTGLIASINALDAVANTPLAESYYEVTRYFRGLSRYQGAGQGNYTSPIQYRCQKNFGIVITDGLPTHDSTFNAPDNDADSRLPDWDGVGSGQAEGIKYADGTGVSAGEGSSLYLDDIAKFAYDIDMRSSGNDLANVSFNDAAFTKQNIETFTVGFSTANQMLEDSAERGGGGYYTANNSAQLNSALSSALQSIKERTSSAAAIATNSTRLDADTLIYQAKFNSADWGGELLAFGINADGSVGPVSWRTGTAGLIPAAASRNIFTRNALGGTAFQWVNLTLAQQAELSVSNAVDGATVVNWLRGGSSGATLTSGEVLRSRATVLGDIVNSNPVYVGAQNYGYTVPNDPLVTTEPADTYQVFLETKNSATKLLLVGANDGMVHGFNAETGAELFAYVPTSLFKQRTTTPGATPGLRYLTKSSYAHKYYVDGSIGVGDVYDSNVVNGGWKTYAVGGLGAGGRGIYALNITNPAGFSAGNVLWEITAPDTSTASNDWNDLGYTYGVPVIARTNDNTWVAIFGNGYESNTGRAALYVVNALTGALIKKIVVDTDTTADVDNGLSTPSVVVDANRQITYVYAGDLKGNLWKFDLRGAVSAWDSYKTSGNGASKVSVPLFIAKNASNQVQPITSGLEIGSHPTDGGLMLYFGTGKYFETTDSVVGSSPQMQSFYGIWDKPVTGASLNGWEITARSELQRQQITFESADYRSFSNNAINWSAQRGWYMDLAPPPYSAAGERSVSLPLLRAGRIIFTTLIPSADPCLAGGASWLMEIDAFTGGSLNYSVLDVNNDGEFNNADKIACGSGLLCYAGGKRSPEGIIKTPGIVSAGKTEYKYSGGSSGNVLVVKEKGSLKEGRMSWRQLR
ncbi:pilus assembly protein [Pseudomonas anguilliseptica]|uniref:Type IV pilus assembly protein PilY1 n=1 Tax=Pseudomonas anguilliseptica TaxID=53406 RepID=A0A1H5AIT9_PSEAG|nr:PilC/PilY family type IV pilus protein [Pseudomonas anguilliseptica]SED42293.1 type IV pilus assembly protein PilY1 [Pseudomonas anguilliseptica]